MSLYEDFTIRGPAPWQTRVKIEVVLGRVVMTTRSGDIEQKLDIGSSGDADELGKALIRASKHAQPPQYFTTDWDVRDGISIPRPAMGTGTDQSSFPCPSIDDLAN